MSLENKHIVYFLGIGGIGMSALARWFLHLGKEVCGYDRTRTPLTDRLEKEGAHIHFTDDIALIPDRVRNGKTEALIIYTPAIPKNHKEYNFLLDNGFEVYKRSEILGMITKDLYSVAVAGTHGKTTTSSMIAHILKSAERSCVALMGGILQGYESNLIIEGEHAPDTIAVLEADEYDRSFLRLSPDIAVVTSADPDHLDIYGAHEAMKSSFKQFVAQVKPGGHIFINEALSAWLTNTSKSIYNHSYALESSHNRATDIRTEGTEFVFDYRGEIEEIPGISLAMPGFHNVENAVAAISVAQQLGIDSNNIRKALASFRGIKRRFEYHIKEKNLVYIDDYAHHPAEINAFISSVKAIYPGKKITAIFQPHLFSRTSDFADEFALSLDAADEVILLNIYPARELPIEGVTSGIILDKMQNERKMLVEDAQLLEQVAVIQSDVFLTIGAGDIDRFVQPIKEILMRRI